jgi:hypothetical protein
MARSDRLGLGLFGDDRAAQGYAFIADTYCPWPCDQALNFFLAATTE